ncbi:DUF6020 family protein [Lachnobacterium bovis]|uniref:Dolichyl-phosphate-mannose-protein mannosyltransferase n=1 Tax=Lachnobacterium bovis TaxID=140626 RepID=A0A1H9NZB2_9FIRM|nr:DUF6020 family protein [Lachnobacterium bovis]SER40909.1 hypothetical protein SAMN02910429_00005 [Lachnobacterium bovis]
MLKKDMKFKMTPKNGYLFVIKNLFAIMFSIMIVLANKITITSDIFSSNKEAFFSKFGVLDICLFICCFLLTNVGITIIEKIINLSQKKNEYVERTKNVKVFVAFFMLLIICWLPCVLTFYPGGVFADTTYTLLMAKGEAVINNHQPLLYTWIWEIMYGIGGLFALSEYHVIFLCTIVQAIAMALVISCFLYSLYKKGFSKKFIILSTIYFGLFNLIPLYVVSLWKDTFFSIFFFAFSVLLFNIFWNRAEERKFIKWQTILLYSVLAYLISFSRNNGIYAFFFFTVVLLVYFAYHKEKRLLKYSAIISFILICVFSVIRGPIYDSFKYNVDDKVESFGIPLQQVCYIIENNGDVSNEDMEVINNIIPQEDIHKLYCPLIVDKIKWAPSFNKEYLNDHYRLFLRTYLNIVRKNPIKALKGWALANEGFWDISRQNGAGYIHNTMWFTLSYPIRDVVKDKCGFSFQNLYSVDKKISSALFAWFIFLSVVIGYRRRRGGSYLALMPAIGIWITMIVATPLAYSLRYVFPLVLLVPMGIAVMIAPKYSLLNTESFTEI